MGIGTRVAYNDVKVCLAPSFFQPSLPATVTDDAPPSLVHAARAAPDPVERAGLLPRRRVRHPDREPRVRRARQDRALVRRRQVPRNGAPHDGAFCLSLICVEESASPRLTPSAPSLAVPDRDQPRRAVAPRDARARVAQCVQRRGPRQGRPARPGCRRPACARVRSSPSSSLSTLLRSPLLAANSKLTSCSSIRSLAGGSRSSASRCELCEALFVGRRCNDDPALALALRSCAWEPSCRGWRACLGRTRMSSGPGTERFESLCVQRRERRKRESRAARDGRLARLALLLI